jgi:hypothetical protein
MKRTKSLAKCNFVTSFDLWLSKGMHDVFSFIIKFENYLQVKHVIIRLFERKKTIKQSLEINPIKWLDQYGLKKKKIKNKESNLNGLKSIVNCEILGLDQANFQGI